MQYLPIEIQALIVFFSEIIFLYLKTINIKAVSNGNTSVAIISNTGISMTWLIGVTISVNSILNGNVLPIIAFIIGGAIGTYLAMSNEKSISNLQSLNVRQFLLSSLRLF